MYPPVKDVKNRFPLPVLARIQVLNRVSAGPADIQAHEDIHGLLAGETGCGINR
jgi:hypothetical protein